MRFAYADPPYLGCGQYYDHPESYKWNKLETHRDLIKSLIIDFPDGWALSLSASSLWQILPLCPPHSRVCAWVKPFASFKPNVGLAWAWEPVILYGGRKITREQPTVRDWVSANITLKKGLTGAKPKEFCKWMFAALNAQKGDEFVDLFPGTGIVTDCWNDWIEETLETQDSLFAGQAGSHRAD